LFVHPILKSGPNVSPSGALSAIGNVASVVAGAARSSLAPDADDAGRKAATGRGRTGCRRAPGSAKNRSCCMPSRIPHGGRSVPSTPPGPRRFSRNIVVIEVRVNTVFTREIALGATIGPPARTRTGCARSRRARQAARRLLRNT